MDESTPTHDPSSDYVNGITAEQQRVIDDLKNTDLYHQIFFQSPAALE